MQMSAPTAQRTFLKDVQQLYRTIDASTGSQASIVGIDAMTVQVSLRPKSGHNAHAEFLVMIECSTTYPTTCPEVIFNTPIYHPNVDPSSGIVCLSILNYWRSCYSLLDLVKAILYLIDHPNYDWPTHPLGIPKDSAQLARNSARLLAGLPVNGLRFPPNREWVEWARVNGCLPSEEEGDLEKAEEEAYGKKEEFNQECDEEVDESINPASLGDDVMSTAATSYGASDATSDSIPSVAKIRHLLDPDEEEYSWGSFEPNVTHFAIKSQRILIWPPNSDDEFSNSKAFFFVEFLGTRHHRSILGQNYGALFICSVLHECQSHPESRQTSSDCPWYPIRRVPEFSYHSYGRYSSSLNLSNMFNDETAPTHDLTVDFCPWSALDGKGKNALFDGLFFEGRRHRGNFTCFLDEANGSESGSQGIRRLFESCSLDYKEIVRSPHEEPENKAHSWFFSHAKRLILGSETLLTEEHEVSAHETDEESQKVSSSSSLTSYSDDFGPGTLITECFFCLYVCDGISEPIDEGLAPLRNWVLRQTRWPFRLAPQQSIDLSMTGIQIPPWRASSGRMMSDVYQFCARNQDVSNLVLFDPMALSPLSPLLNLMRREASPRPRLTGVLWMTPLDALSPFYRVPVPLTQHQKHCDDEEHEGGEDVYPTPTSLRFLAITAFLTNWVAWLSRMESYTVLGLSRFRPMLVSAPVAAHVLQPCSLGCGQAPLLDLWPLWLLRRLLTLSLRLSQLRVPFLRCGNQHLWWLFPFSDLDEI